MAFLWAVIIISTAELQRISDNGLNDFLLQKKSYTTLCLYRSMLRSLWKKMLAPHSPSPSPTTTTESPPVVIINEQYAHEHGWQLSLVSPLVSYVSLRQAIKAATKKSTSCLPDEVIWRIFDYCGFNSSTLFERRKEERGQSNMNSNYASLHIPSATLKTFRPIGVQFHVISWDQGWTSEPGVTGERNSHSWGEASVISSSASNEQNDRRHFVYRNLRARDVPEEQWINFGRNSPIVQAIIAAGSVEPVTIGLWLRSQYPGWTNNISSASIKVTWEVTDDVLLIDDIDQLILT